jgi:hypothetical protein
MARNDEELVEVLEEIDRYRTATEDALQQLDWCIGYFVGCNKSSIAKALGANRAHIRSMLRRPAQPVPTDAAAGGGKA